MSKQKIHYMVTRPDGTIPPTSYHGGPYPVVDLTQYVGQVVDHPTPGRPWYDESPFSYFRTYTRRGVAESLERIDWPARLWAVEPLGETGNWDRRHSPYWVLCHRLRVLEEVDAWRVFGPRGRKVLDLIEQQIPELAQRWAGRWAADPVAAREDYDRWKAQLTRHSAMRWAEYKIRPVRREAALHSAQALAGAAAKSSALSVTDDEEVLKAVSHRAKRLVVAELVHDLLRADDDQRAARSTLRAAF